MSVRKHCRDIARYYAPKGTSEKEIEEAAKSLEGLLDAVIDIVDDEIREELHKDTLDELDNNGLF